MRKTLLLSSLLLLCVMSPAQVSQNVTLLSNWFNPSTPAEPTYHIKYNGIWGWADPQDNKEYAIIGSSEGVYFIDVSVPTAPVVRDYVPGRRNNCIWREIKTYQNYCYMVSDDAAPNSLQIVDMSSLPDSVTIIRDDNTIIERSHTIWVDGNKLYCGIPKGPSVGGSSKLAVFSLANPGTPVLLRKIEQDHPGADQSHDMFVRNDTVYASMSYSGLFIYKWTGTNFQQINSLTTYPSQGYNHSTSLTPDGKTLIMLDEVPTGLPCKSVDVTNLTNISVLTTFRSTTTSTATPHNPFVVNNNRVVIAYYQDGVQIFDISNPSNPVRTGYYDTNPTNCPSCPNPNYSGCWGAYVDLPSGIVIASDMQNGLFVLDANGALVTDEESEVMASHPSLYPNPARHKTTLSVSLKKDADAVVCVTDLYGKTLLHIQHHFTAGGNTLEIDTKQLSAGIYFVKVSGEGFSSTGKLVVE
ncbi:MAG: choice-of-anchor B family protein [Bacteroidia bacterium]|nr:choice-of-anchor B family protein [Bacteroidia bacterium]